MNSNWFNPGNWNPAIPSASSTVTIPNVTTNYPTLSNPAACKTIIIESGASFIGSEYLTVENAIYVWNGNNYLSYVGGIGSLPDGIIPAINGFMVRTDIHHSTVTIPLNSRLHSNIPYYKAENHTDLFSLKAKANQMTDETFIYYREESSTGYDSQFDAYKLMGSEEAPQLYSMISNKILSVNTLPFEGNEVIDLGFKCGKEGQYSLTARGMESFDFTTPIWLEDLKTGIWQDLRSNPVYNFTYSIADAEKRFKLHFKDEERSLKSTDISIYTLPNTLVVANKSGYPGAIRVFDLSGNQILETGLTSAEKTQIPVNYPAGIYYVKVITEKGTSGSKVFLK
jgi:hypothetical protein